MTLVDLVYRDAIIYLYLICFASSTSILNCLSLKNDTLTLSYEFATAYSAIIVFFVSCLSISLIFSGVLRLISIINKSEAAGLQLLGPDYIALNKIRLVSVTVSSFFPSLMIYFFNAHPGFFPLLYGNESTSFVQDIDKNLVKALYLVLPCSAALVNTIAKVCSDYTRKKIDQQVNIFTICGQQQINEEKWTFSLETVIGIPLIILFGFLSSFSDCVERLTFFFPLQIMALGFIIPFFVIKKNIKIMNFLKQNYIKTILEYHLIKSLIKRNSTVIPLETTI